MAAYEESEQMDVQPNVPSTTDECDAEGANVVLGVIVLVYIWPLLEA